MLWDATTPAPCPNCEQLRTHLEQAGAQLQQALARIAELETRLSEQAQRLEQLEREAHRQAAPFRRPEKKRNANPKGPGRKPGHPPAHRPPPPSVDECAEVPLDKCPHCGGPVHDLEPLEQIVEDIPEVVVRRLRLITYRGRCRRCGTVRSVHPEQVSLAGGAAGTHLGRRALALVADLNKRCGLTMRKTCDIVRTHFGISLSPGGLSQALDRLAQRLQPTFAELEDAVRKSDVIHGDETGWWLGGASSWLWVFTNPRLTLYTIDNRSAAVVERVLGADYDGVLVSDCLSSYNPHLCVKSKCCAHHLKAISQGQIQAPDSRFLGDVRRFFAVAMELHRARELLGAKRYEHGVRLLDAELVALLAPEYERPAEQRVANRLRRQREHLLTFLKAPGVDPTNNLAERQLRPAVIARKLSCGNKTASGAHTFTVLASLAATCRQQGRSFAELVGAVLGPTGHQPSPPALPTPKPT